MVQVITVVLISLHTLGPCYCFPNGYVGNRNKVKRGLFDTWTRSGINREIAVSSYERYLMLEKSELFCHTSLQWTLFPWRIPVYKRYIVNHINSPLNCRLVKSKNVKSGKTEQEDIIQIPDDMFVTCKGCLPTEELCSTTIKSATEKHFASTEKHFFVTDIHFMTTIQ